MKFTFELPWLKPQSANVDSSSDAKKAKTTAAKPQKGKAISLENLATPVAAKSDKATKKKQTGTYSPNYAYGKDPVLQPFPLTEEELSQAIFQLTGFVPKSISIYVEALHHASLHLTGESGQKWNNERLEFLGDAVIDLVLADQLYERFPDAHEGFLTELRAKVVSTKKLDELAKSLGVPALLHFDTRNQTLARTKTIFADALEAIIGAIFRDQGYEATRKFVTERVVLAHLDLELLSLTETNHKSKVFEWAQREQRELKFIQVEDEGTAPVGRKFVMALVVDGLEITRATDYNKKSAEQRASALFCEKLEAGWGIKASKKKKKAE